MEKKRVVMKDIAEKAGVHQTTVSLALKNNPRIPKATRERIQRLAEEMGYRPDPYLSSLVAYRQNSQIHLDKQIIALVMDVSESQLFYESNFYPSMVECAFQRADELGYKIEIFRLGKEYKNSKSLDRVLRTRNIQGVLIGAIYHPQTIIDLSWDLYSVVKINMLPIALEADTVVGNYMLAARLAMRELLANGHKRIGIAISNEDEIHLHHMFTAGYRVAQRHIPEKQRVEPLYFNRMPNEPLMKLIKGWIKRERLDAVLSCWNNIAEAAWEISVKESQNCRFVSLEADQNRWPHGGVSQSYHKMAKTAVDVLIGKMKIYDRGLPDSATYTLINPFWNPVGEWPPEKIDYQTQTVTYK